MAAVKMHEWVAHPCNVSCVALGTRSHQVLASGGEDRRVNVWRLRARGDGATNVWSLGGNSSVVSCLAFDEPESVLVSGAEGGSVRLYDLQEGKLSRVMQGHRARVESVHCHPFGDFVASGGADASVKIWDARKKACIQTYRGHSGDVQVVKFSPDGRWVASAASGDGLIRIWDLTAGKVLKTLPAGRTDACHATHLEFSPFEFVLASAASDRVVRLYDLEVWRELGASPPEVHSSSSIRSLAFSGTGKSVLAATDQSLRQWDWDLPRMRQRSHLAETGWDSVAQLAVATPDVVLAVCFASNFVSVWSAPVAEDEEGDVVAEPKTSAAALQRSQRPTTAAAAKASPTPTPFEVVEDDDDDENTVVAESKAERRRQENKAEEKPARPGSAASRRGFATTERGRPTTTEGRDAKLADPKASSNEAEEGMTELLMSRPSVRALRDRLEALRRLRKDWSSGRVASAIESLCKHCDAHREEEVLTRFALAADFLNAIELRSETLRLDDALELLPVLDAMLASPKNTTPSSSSSSTSSSSSAEAAAPRQARVALEAAAVLVELFGAYVASSRLSSGTGVDLARDERKQRCNRCHALFGALKQRLPTLRRTHRTYPALLDAAAVLDAKLNNYSLKAGGA